MIIIPLIGLLLAVWIACAIYDRTIGKEINTFCARQRANKAYEERELNRRWAELTAAIEKLNAANTNQPRREPPPPDFNGQFMPKKPGPVKGPGTTVH